MAVIIILNNGRSISGKNIGCISKKSHINTLTINVFSWAKLQPSEDEYNFTELDEIINLLTEHGF